MANGHAQRRTGAGFGVKGNLVEQRPAGVLPHRAENGADEQGGEQPQRHAAHGIHKIDLCGGVYALTITKSLDFLHTIASLW